MRVQKLKEPKLYYDPEMNDRSAEGWEFKIFSCWLVRYALVILSCLTFIIWYYKNYNVSSVSDEQSWDFLIFTQSYPLACCMWSKTEHHEQYCHFAQNPHVWTIHGVWPSNKDSDSPSFCHNIKFNETDLEPLKTKLEVEWPSIESENSAPFWAHEWKKHGTCAIDDQVLVDSEFSYFKLGLDLHDQFNVTSVLNAAGITPDDEKTYGRDQFLDAIKAAWGKDPYLACYKDEKSGKTFAMEIRLCFSKQLELLDCDDWQTMDLKCPTDGIMYPVNLSSRRL